MTEFVSNDYIHLIKRVHHSERHTIPLKQPHLVNV